MRNVIIIMLALLGMVGCFDESNLDYGTPDTFVKYFNGGFDDEAQDIKSTSDGGYILLATTEVRPNTVTEARFKIKLIKTDQFGTTQWQKIYPKYDSAEAEKPRDSISFKGKAVLVLKDESGADSGYVIVGDSIQKGSLSQSYLRIMLTDLEGNITRAQNIKPNFAVQGQAVAVNAAGNFVVLGSSVNPQASNNMFLAEFSANLDSLWSRTYGAGTSTLTNRLFIDESATLFWSGTITKENDKSDIRFVKAPSNSENVIFDLPIGNPTSKETGNDICPYGFGYAVIGTTDASGDDDILFKRLTQDGTELASQTFGFDNQAENGLSICQVRDGGLILLGSVDTNVGVGGRGGKDYILIKINAFGDTEFSQIFGSKNDDIGAGVLANTDGSFTILGTTIFGGIKTLSLVKTDNLGRIE